MTFDKHGIIETDYHYLLDEEPLKDGDEYNYSDKSIKTSWIIVCGIAGETAGTERSFNNSFIARRKIE